MSITLTKRPLHLAMAEARAFKDLFARNFDRWEIAGSIRRRRKEVGDVDHVVMPQFGDRADGDSLFASVSRVNLVWHQLDQLVRAGQMAKHIRGGSVAAWGEKHRSIEFRGNIHEIYLAEPETWGMHLAIRTGSAEFSRMLMKKLRQKVRRCIGGQVWACELCVDHCRPDNIVDDVLMGCKPCIHCNETNLRPVGVIPARTEEMFFSLCGVEFETPERRSL